MAKAKKIAAPSLFDSQPAARTVIEKPVMMPVVMPMAVTEPATEQVALPPLEGDGGRPGREALLRDGTFLNTGDEVNILPGLIGYNFLDRVFVISEIIPFEWCESKSLVKVYQKETPSFIVAGRDGDGVDANWFKKVEA